MIYVDDMGLKAEVPNGKRVVRGKWSHLYADTHEELMTIAQLIGLNPKWIQHPGTDKEHFDVVQSKRAAAIKAGARPVSWRHAGEFFAAQRKAAAAARQARADNPDYLAGQQKPPQAERPRPVERERGPVWLGRFAGEMANCKCGTEFIRPVNGTYDTCLRCELTEKAASAPPEYQHEATQWAEYNRQLGIVPSQREERQAQ